MYVTDNPNHIKPRKSLGAATRKGICLEARKIIGQKLFSSVGVPFPRRDGGGPILGEKLGSKPGPLMPTG
jgi:hypothetical protein